VAVKKTKSEVAVATELVRDAIERLEGMEDRWKHFVLNGIREGLGLGSAPALVDPRSPPPPPAPPSGTARAFMREKRPATDLQRIACLASYLARARNQTEFKGKDLKDLDHGESIADWRVAVANATKAKYLASARHGVKRLTTFGEDIVDALPDQSKVNQVRSDIRRRTPRRKGGRRRAARS